MKQMQAVSEIYEENVEQSRSKDQIEGGACLYTQEQLEEQVKEQEEQEAQLKMEDFLSSLK